VEIPFEATVYSQMCGYVSTARECALYALGVGLEPDLCRATGHS
jgi:hypothetical protein